MVFGAGRIDFLRDSPEAVAQAVMTRLKLWSGEWFLDTEEGTPYQVGALGKNTSASIDPMIRDRVIETQGVTGIVAYDRTFDPDERKNYVNLTINTLYGVTAIQGVL